MISFFYQSIKKIRKPPNSLLRLILNKTSHNYLPCPISNKNMTIRSPLPFQEYFDRRHTNLLDSGLYSLEVLEVSPNILLELFVECIVLAIEFIKLKIIKIDTTETTNNSHSLLYDLKNLL